MGKDSQQKNKKHRKKKDRKGKRERSIEEHMKRKQKKLEKKKKEEYEETRYSFDPHSLDKLFRTIKEMLEYSTETHEALPQVFSMLDSGYEVDLTDIQDGFVREKLEKVLDVFSKQVDKQENEEGHYVYTKAGNKNLENQITEFLAKSGNKREEWMQGMSCFLEGKLTQQPKQSEEPEEVQPRAKSLMELHLEKKPPKKRGNQKPETYMYGHKTLQKRFKQGKMFNSLV